MHGVSLSAWDGLPSTVTNAALVFPDFDAVNRSTDLESTVGALLTVALLFAVLMLIVSAVAWAISSSTGNYQAASRSRIGVWVSLGTAAMAGSAVGWMNFLLDIGRSLT